VTTTWIVVGLVAGLALASGTVVAFRARSKVLISRGNPPLEAPAPSLSTTAPDTTPSLGALAVLAPAPPGTAAPAEPQVAAPAVPTEPAGLGARLGSARSLFDRVRQLRGRGAIAPEDLAQVEEALLRADVGVTTTSALIETVRTSAAEGGLDDGGIAGALRFALLDVLGPAPAPLVRDAEPGRVAVWLFVGVNGVGKTTTLGKLAKRASMDAPVLLAAADTFRAAAADQLEIWAERADCDVVRAEEGADPGAVVHDALHRAKSKGIGLVLADTAGRLHNKASLLQELAKVRRVADRDPGQVTEVLLVIDATTGQNALAQAKEFSEAVGVTGLVLTKLDGTARGGVVLAVQRDLGIPVRLVGVGERDVDLIDFDPVSFVDALLGD
jgi:fused signal recognition particle receptor